MREISKILLILTIFCGLAIGITSGMIINKNISLSKNQISNNLKQDNYLKDDSEKELNNNLTDKDFVFDNQANTTYTNIGIEYHQNVNDNAPGAKLNDYYDENDLKWTKLNYQDEYIDVEYYQISGLKNKTIEKQINEKIRKSALEQANAKYDSQTKNKVKIKQYKMSSFANVISISNIESDYNLIDNTYINIDLNTGKELKIEDLFTKDADILGIIRGSFYRLMGILDEDDEDSENVLYTNVV